MKYVYCYKTSDGVRHEAMREAASREEVFSALRREGIRPIKVVAADGSKANGEVRGVRLRVLVGSVFAAAALVGLVTAVVVSATSRGDAFAMTGLEEKTTQAMAGYRQKLSELGFDAKTPLLDLPLLYDGGKLRASIEQGRIVIGWTRESVRGIFRDLEKNFPDMARRSSAQRLYGELMREIDADEELMTNLEVVRQLLDDNLGKWRIYAGRLAVDDPVLKEQIDLFR